MLSLFPELVSCSTLPMLSAPRPCRCGSTMATPLSSCGPHAGRLICSACGAFLGWASHAAVAESRARFVTGVSSFEPGARP
jgi:hypothetical protein